MTQTTSGPENTGMSRRTKLFVAWTVFSALAVWFGLSVAERLAAERCTADGLNWNWTAWSCAQPGGTIILPSSLRRADPFIFMRRLG
ncbi:MAG: hypothetical protein ABL901_15465 [Hyphomicrobiaceae bacterium]